MAVTQANGHKDVVSAGPNGQAVFLDSGTTISELPAPMVHEIAAAFPSAQEVQPGTYQIDCSVAEQDGTVDFVFGSTTVHVPYADFIQKFSNGACQLGVVPAPSGKCASNFYTSTHPLS